ncbi:glycosyltransferase family 4 protein [Vagococcus vulneris]|uniref:1,2-diacylglycerol 3-glucosyltransferase n=1 Tax=Vagococcus vulneris TaxID=1977869 RepID=A0A429ZTB6_9ENTE|nr:glycosyltransferase family 4 protein [Vagococcus vulneris]RST96928.1 1,2-diacylglycerol 3-glucosyltransferase [Vagococcus vulneris]
MRVGFFTDTYLPQVSGVSTSISTLKRELEKRGHEVYVFTTTDPNAAEEDSSIIRLPSIPFVSFKERRIMIRGMAYAYSTSKKLNLDIIHTHTEFGVGILGKMTAKKMGIPCLHTYHTMYEDYLHYIAHGKLIRPSHVKRLSRLFTQHMSGVICPSQRVVDKMEEYEVLLPKRIIPTGIDIAKFSPVSQNEKDELLRKYQLDKDNLILLSVSRISYEKNIQAILRGMPKIINKYPNVKLLIVGDGPYRESLEKIIKELSIERYVIFTGEIRNNQIAVYYQIASLLVSASDSETQGLTYTEAMAAKLQVVAKGNQYLNELFDKKTLGTTYLEDTDFAEAVIDYVQSDIKIRDTDWENRLYDISSVSFGERVESFYESTIDYYYTYGNEDADISEDRLLTLKFLKNRF